MRLPTCFQAGEFQQKDFTMASYDNTLHTIEKLPDMTADGTET